MTRLRRLRAWFVQHQVLTIVVAIGIITVPAAGAIVDIANDAQDAAETAQASADKAQAAIDAVERSRSEGQLAGCRTSVDVAEKINALNDRTQDLLRAVLGGTPRAEAVEFLELQIGLYEAIKVPYRDCTPAGMAAFVDTGGVGGFLPPGSPPP